MENDSQNKTINTANGDDTVITASKTRRRLGTRAIISGLVVNAALSAFKLIIGSLSGSVAITADAWNNISDSANSVISLVSIILAEKPADEKHPFGHARFEYVASLTIAIGMLTVALRFGQSSVQRILHPVALNTDGWTFAVLGVSILFKLLQLLIYRRIGRRIVSAILIASSKDSLSDVFATGGVLISTIFYSVRGINLDGPAGLLISIFIAWSAIQIIFNTATQLLGSHPSEETTQLLHDKIVETDNRILGMHDLIIHEYGPGRVFATAHVELDNSESFPESHLILDRVERKIMRECGINLLLHAEPSYPRDETYNELFAKLSKAAVNIYRGTDIHSLFLFKSREGNPIAAFDVFIDDTSSISDDMFFSEMRKQAAEFAPGLTLWITIDREYTSSVLEDRPSMDVTLNEDFSNDSDRSTN